MSFVDSMPASTMMNNVGWPHVYIAAAAFLVCMFVTFVILLSSGKIKINPNKTGFTYLKFFYATFLKPHESDGEGQQGALESFYKTQVCYWTVSRNQVTDGKATAYDATRRPLLRGREDMLALVAAQLNFKAENKQLQRGKAVWVDVSAAPLTRRRC